MDLKNLTFLLFLFSLSGSLSSQTLYGLTNLGEFVSFDTESLNYTIISSEIPTGIGMSGGAFDPVNKRYFYTFIQEIDVAQTFVEVDVTTGEYNTYTAPYCALYNIEYSISDNSVFGLSFDGFGSLDLSTGEYELISTEINLSGSYGGVSTFNQDENIYYFVLSSNDFSLPDSLYSIDLDTEEVMFQMVPSTVMRAIEYDKSNNHIYTVTQSSLGEFNTITNEYTEYNLNVTGLNGTQGQATYDPNSQKYYSIKVGDILEDWYTVDTLYSIDINAQEITYIDTTHLQMLHQIEIDYEFQSSIDHIIETAESLELTIQPVPACDFVEIKGLKNESFFLKIYNSMGELLDVEMEKSSDNIFRLHIDTYDPGMYLIKIYSNSGVIEEKFLKH